MREIDPRDCQHGWADSQQEEIGRLRADLIEAEGAVADLMKLNEGISQMCNNALDLGYCDMRDCHDCKTFKVRGARK